MHFRQRVLFVDVSRSMLRPRWSLLAMPPSRFPRRVPQRYMTSSSTDEKPSCCATQSCRKQESSSMPGDPLPLLRALSSPSSSSSSFRSFSSNEHASFSDRSSSGIHSTETPGEGKRESEGPRRRQRGKREGQGGEEPSSSLSSNPYRHPIPRDDPAWYDTNRLDTEMRRVFDVCHGCRRCFSLCTAFPKLFDLIDTSQSGELDSVPSSSFPEVTDRCTLCDMCFLTKCPYVPPHPFNIDFPHLVLRSRAVTEQAERKGHASPSSIHVAPDAKNGRRAWEGVLDDGIATRVEVKDGVSRTMQSESIGLIERQILYTDRNAKLATLAEPFRQLANTVVGSPSDSLARSMLQKATGTIA